MQIDLNNLTIKKVHESLLNGEYSAVDLVQRYLKEIELRNKELNAYIEVFDDVLDQARVADEKIKNGTATLLTGIPIAVKDNILIKGKIASAASKILSNYVASYDATVISKLKNAGAVFLGRANMDDAAMGSSTETSYYGTSRNPHDTTRVPGGSSGGATAAVAANLALVALGSDTGGSIRQPAAFCGLVGLKPTYGSVSRHGLIAMASSLDVIGPITKNIEDAQIVFDFIKGKDSFDSTSFDLAPKSFTLSPKPLVIGVPRAFTESEGIDKSVIDNFNNSMEKLKKMGYTIKDISLPTIGYSLAVYYILMPAEASTNLARFDGIKYGFHKSGVTLLDDYKLSRGEGFGKEVRRRILLGAHVLSSGYHDAYYNKAIAVRQLITDDLSKAFKEVDIIATPTTPSPAFKIGDKSNNPLSMYLADIFTVSANIASVPAISVPSGFVETEGKQLPLGVQFTAPAGGENLLFSVGTEFFGK